MPRRYVPYTKHKAPKGFGSLCPKLPSEQSQALLDRAISVAGLGEGKLWAIDGDWCFGAHRSPGDGDDAWHGFPVIGAEVDERVYSALLEAGLATAQQVRRLRRQKSLPGDES